MRNYRKCQEHFDDSLERLHLKIYEYFPNLSPPFWRPADDRVVDNPKQVFYTILSYYPWVKVSHNSKANTFYLQSISIVSWSYKHKWNTGQYYSTASKEEYGHFHLIGCFIGETHQYGQDTGQTDNFTETSHFLLMAVLSWRFSITINGNPGFGSVTCWF